MSLLTHSLYAQQEQSDEQSNEQEVEKKKPSWSTGLPERKAAPSMNKPSVDLNTPDMDLDEGAVVEIPTTAVELEEPKFDIPEITIQPAAPTSSVPPVAQSSSRSRQTGQANDNNAPRKKSDTNETPMAKVSMAEYHEYPEYDWAIFSSEPIKIPKSLSFSYKSVDLEVHLNPEGKVVRVKRVSDLTSNLILNYSSKTLKKWQFRPPAEVGVTEVLVRNMNVNLVAR